MEGKGRMMTQMKQKNENRAKTSEVEEKKVRTQDQARENKLRTGAIEKLKRNPGNS